LNAEMSAAEQLYASEGPALVLDQEWYYEQRWGATLVARALASLQADFRGDAKVFEKLQPFICCGAAVRSQEEVAQELAISIDTLRSHLSRLRARYRALLCEEFARTLLTTIGAP
jgi:DNA-directed RNA polymerase specialized sigma24 family protein